jgi:hypothetical protein
MDFTCDECRIVAKGAREAVAVGLLARMVTVSPLV